MIRLDTTSTILQTVLAAAVTTNALEYYATYNDHTSTAYTGGQTRSTSNNTTDVNIVAAPGSSTVRDIDFVNIYNKDTVSATVTVKTDVSGTEHILVKITLQATDTLQYIHGFGWKVIDLNGNTKQTASSASVSVTQRFSGDASTVNFTLTNSITDQNLMEVYVEGIYQQRNTWSVASTTLTFTGAPPSGTNNIEVRYFSSISITAGTLASIQVLTSGTTYTRPAGIRKIFVECQGAGGGSGGGAADAAADSTAFASAGAGGGYCNKLIDATNIATATIAIGSAGAAGAAGNNNGTAGGNTTWSDGTNTLTANGGGAGLGAADGGSVKYNGGTGGTATGGTINLSGSDGERGFSHTATVTGASIARGGSSYMGRGGVPNLAFTVQSTAGQVGIGYGAGASGALVHANNATAAGAAGIQGVIIVWEYV